jgi:hypothetical protein
VIHFHRPNGGFGLVQRRQHNDFAEFEGPMDNGIGSNFVFCIHVKHDNLGFEKVRKLKKPILDNAGILFKGLAGQRVKKGRYFVSDFLLFFPDFIHYHFHLSVILQLFLAPRRSPSVSRCIDVGAYRRPTTVLKVERSPGQPDIGGIGFTRANSGRCACYRCSTGNHH